MKIFIFGSNGMLGNYVKKYLSNFYETIEITRIDYDLSKLNINTLYNLLTNKYLDENDIVINCAGVIPQSCKERNLNTKLYFTINSMFPVLLSQICDKVGAKMVHITTDCVFSGKDGNYFEDSIHDETNDYGMSKSLGELCNATIIRTSIIGEELNNKHSLLEWVRINKEKEINGFVNHFWNGVTCLQLAKIIYKIIKNNMYWQGVRHIFSPEKVSKYELIYMINEIYNFKKNINIFYTEKIDKTLNSLYDINTFNIPPIKEQIIELENFYKT
jgi:dTDP-4-dehydrorhamnose reductase